MTNGKSQKSKDEAEWRLENEKHAAQNELNIQSDRIRKILDVAIFKIKLLTFVPKLIENNGEILREHLSSKDVDFILYVCSHNSSDRRPEDNIRETIDMLNRINMREKKGVWKRRKSFVQEDNFEAHVAYAIDLLLKPKSLIDLIATRPLDVDPLTQNFIDSLQQLRKIADTKLSISATEEINKENDLKTAFRASMLLSDNITELEEQMEKQRVELGNEYDKKAEIMTALNEQIEDLKTKSKEEINHIINESELAMMKDYLKSTEMQEQLSIDAKHATHKFDTLLEDHLSQEKAVRTKCFKVETQLASWLTKYDSEIGEKQAEFELLENTYNTEKEEFEILQEKFEFQKKEYVTLMKEKEEEERILFEEMAFQFLMNRSARRIQKYWREYRERKKLRKRGRKSKKKGSADKKSKKGKKKEEQLTLRGGPDPNAVIDSKFGGDLMSEIKDKEAFAKTDVVVDL